MITVAVIQTMLALSAALVLSTAAPEEAAPPEQGPAQRVLEEVTVTAQRRMQDLVDIPLSVTAISGRALEEGGALDLTYIGQVTPNATVEAARGTNNALAAYIRGIGQQDHIAGFESGVALYVDDVVYSRPQLALLDLLNVDRIEVLRGPQGVLYGRNSMGGAIKYVSNRLDDDLQMKLHSRVGNHGMRDFIVDGAFPVGESVRTGVTLASFALDGFGMNRSNVNEANYAKSILAARASTEWTPSDAWFLRLSADVLQDDSSLRRGHRTRPGAFSGAPVLKHEFDSRAGNTHPPADSSASGASLLLEWQANERWQWRGIFAGRSDETWKPVDLDALPTIDVDVSTWDRNRQHLAELQALYSSERIDLVAGWFALDSSADTVLGAVLGATGALIGRPGLGNELRGFVDTSNQAAFANVDFSLGKQWSGSLGGRYTRDERQALVQRRVLVGGVSEFFGGSGLIVNTSSDFAGREVFEKFTPRAALQWRPAEDQQVYLSYSEGFKGGGFDPRGLSTLAPDFDGDGQVSAAEVHAFMKFEPEEVSSWELGWKGGFLDGRVKSSLALFRADYKNIQIPGSVAVDEDGDGLTDTWVGITTNAARARTDGLEWEGRAVLGDRLELSWALGYINARFQQWIDDEGVDVARDRVFANTPKWTALISTRYETPVSWLDTPARLALVSSITWRDDHSQFEIPIAEFDQAEFALWDLGLIWTEGAGRWRVGLHGRNLTDERFKVAGLDISLGLEDNYTVYYGNPRQYWLEVQYRFSR